MDRQTLNYILERLASLVDSIDIVDVIKSNINVVSDSMDHVGKCPFCDYEYNSLFIWEHNQRYECRNCKSSGDVVSFMMLSENIDFEEAIEYLAAFKQNSITKAFEYIDMYDNEKNIDERLFSKKEIYNRFCAEDE